MPDGLDIGDFQRRYENAARGEALPKDVKLIYAGVADDLWYALHGEWKGIWREVHHA